MFMVTCLCEGGCDDQQYDGGDYVAGDVTLLAATSSLATYPPASAVVKSNGKTMNAVSLRDVGAASVPELYFPRCAHSAGSACEGLAKPKDRE